MTEAVRRKPYSVILFDEIEKASRDVLNILLQILDEGQIKDSKGRIIDFKSTIIIMTSNIGAEEFSKKKAAIGFSSATEEEKKSDVDLQQFAIIKDRVMTQLKDFLSPELHNRIDYTIIFNPLTKKTLASILKGKLKDFLATWKGHTDVVLPTFNDKKIAEIIEKIYDPQFGARPLDRYLYDEVEPMIIDKMLAKKTK